MSKKKPSRHTGTSPLVTDTINRLATIEAVMCRLLLTCDDTVKRSMNESQRQCLMAACDDARAVLGYSGRYLTPRQRTRLGISEFQGVK
jgi:hypothetical protein